MLANLCETGVAYATELVDKGRDAGEQPLAAVAGLLLADQAAAGIALTGLALQPV